MVLSMPVGHRCSSWVKKMANRRHPSLTMNETPRHLACLGHFKESLLFGDDLSCGFSMDFGWFGVFLLARIICFGSL